jgi:hypothetical protein
MRREKREQLEAAGWHVGSVADFLELSPEEAAFIEVKLTLGHALRRLRTERHFSERDVAERLGADELRLSEIEAGDPSVSLDLLVRALFSLGATRDEIADAIR